MKLKLTPEIRKRIIRIVALVLCVALFVAIPAVPTLISLTENGYPEQTVPNEYKQKQTLLQTDASVAIIVPTDAPAYVSGIKKTLKKYGMKVDVYTWEKAEAKAESLFNPAKYTSIIYTEAEGIPEALISPLSYYVKNLGGLICIGGPAFTDIYKKTDAGYVKDRTMTGAYDTTKGNESSGELFLDCLCPAYQTYPITNAVRIASTDTQGILPEAEYYIPSDMFSPSPRTYGTGILNERKRRFVPLIEAFDESGEVAGYPAYILMTQSGGDESYFAGIWASFNTNDEEFLSGKLVQNAIACVAAYFDLRTFLFGGGASEYSYNLGDDWQLGAEVLSRRLLFGDVLGATKGTDIEYKINVTVESEGEKIYQKEFEPYDFGNTSDTALGVQSLYSEAWNPSRGGEFAVTAELYGSGVLMDRLSHTVMTYSEEPEAEKKFVSAEGNDLYLDGKVWKCFGVNYMPSSGISLMGDDYEKWVSSSAFDIDVVSKDLRRIKDIGFNAVSVFAYYEFCMDNNNLTALIQLCEKYGLKVFFSFRNIADPIMYTEGNIDKISEMITKHHLAESDTVVGYDIAWETMPFTYEPSWCNSIGMMAFNSEWNEWIVENYGSVEAAEAAWGYTLERDENGYVKCISGHQRATDRDAAYAVIAYNRWVWDWTCDIYGKVVDDIKALDSKHLIGARNGMYTGWPNASLGHLGWEYGALATALDFMGPEGYGYYEEWDDDFETAVFSVAYSRYSCEKPVIWFEFGDDSWTGSNYAAEDGRKTQAEYIRNINRVLTDSQSNGVFYWWYAGGYRMNEGSDYGIINPDGSDRAATELIRKYAKTFKSGGKVEPPEVTVNEERDDYKYGVLNLYGDCRTAFKKASESGKTFGIVNSVAETTSLDTDLSRLSGLDAGPIRNLNACIRAVYYKADGGEWTELLDGATITAKVGSKIELKLKVVNSGYAKWICRKNAGSAAGAVCVDVGGVSFDISSDVSRQELIEVSGITVTSETKRVVTVRMSAEGRAQFGELLSFNIKAN